MAHRRSSSSRNWADAERHRQYSSRDGYRDDRSSRHEDTFQSRGDERPHYERSQPHHRRDNSHWKVEDRYSNERNRAGADREPGHSSEFGYADRHAHSTWNSGSGSHLSARYDEKASARQEYHEYDRDTQRHREYPEQASANTSYYDKRDNWGDRESILHAQNPVGWNPPIQQQAPSWRTEEPYPHGQTREAPDWRNEGEYSYPRGWPHQRDDYPVPPTADPAPLKLGPTNRYQQPRSNVEWDNQYSVPPSVSYPTHGNPPGHWKERENEVDNRHRHNSRTGDKRRYSPSPSKETRHPLIDSPTYKRRRRDSPDGHSTRGRSPYRDSQTYEPAAQYNQEQPRKNAYHQNQNQNRQQQPYQRQQYNNNPRANNNHGNNYQNNNHNTRNGGGGQHRYQPHNHNQKRNWYDTQQRTDHYYKKDKDKDARDHGESRDRGRHKDARDSSSTRTRSRSRSQSSSDSDRSGYSRRGERRDRSRSRSQSRSRSPVEMKDKPKAGGIKHRLPTKSTPVVPTLTDISFAPSRAVLPRSQPIQSTDPSGPRLMTGVGGGHGRLAAGDEGMQVDLTVQTEPPLGNMKNVRLNGSVKLNRSKPSTLKQFFPDAAESETPSAPNAESKAVDSSAMLPPPVPTRAQTVLPSPATTPKAPQQPLSAMTPAIAHSLPMKPACPPPTAVQKTPTSSQALTPQASKEARTPATPRAVTQSSQIPQAICRTFKASRTEIYKIITQVGEGTFGKVYKARNQLSGDHVALKRIRMEGERDGFPVTAMREIKLLQSLRHENVVKLHEMMVSKGLVYMVFEYVHHDLVGVLGQTQIQLAPEHLKSIGQQILQGLAYLHNKGVIHRDLKASNILINSHGALKLADFGLARFYQKRRQADFTNRVITLWYRPPELLLGATVYGPEVDLWSAGCIFLELFVKKPTFQGNDEIHQLEVVFRLLGTPSIEGWPGLSSLPWYELIKPGEVMEGHFRHSFRKWMSHCALDLAERLLTFDPSQRISAEEALNHEYFANDSPEAIAPDLTNLEGEWHELESKRERAKRRAKIAEESASQQK